jgi:lysophospholipase
MLAPAPLFHDIADGPAGGAAHWLQADDGRRLRIGVWPAATDGVKGTVLIFPGRTEYVEKYGREAAFWAAQGFASLAIDWRGQGLADRLHGNPLLGHVGAFSDYQRDVATVIQAAATLNLPQPYVLIAHSMGGAIGLRALMNGLPVHAACFTGPMWDIQMPAPLRLLARAFIAWHQWRGTTDAILPTTSPKCLAASDPFAGNSLTTDPDMWSYMQRQVVTHPDLQLAAPSAHWVNEALTECRALSVTPSPDCPTLTVLGGKETIVSKHAITERMAHWPKGDLWIIPDAKHEIMMEQAPLRRDFHQRLLAFFDAHSNSSRHAQT